jgi:undecaprenyl-diphosphatase
MQNSDLFLLKLFNNSIKCKPLDILMPIITYLGSFIFTVSFCLVALMYPDQSIRSIGIKASVSLTVASLISQFIKTSVNRLRPFLKVQNLNIRKIGIDEYSFPSGHTTAAFSIAVTLALSFSTFSVIFLALAFLVGLSRMYLGVHYPSDVFFGVLLGSTCSWIVHLLL